MFLFKRSNGYWYFYYPDSTGKRRAISTKQTHKNGAVEFVKNFRGEKRKPPEVISISTLRYEVMNYVANHHSHSTRLIYLACFDNLLRMFGNISIRQLDGKGFEYYKDQRVKRVKKVSVNIEIRTLKAIFNLAVKWGMVDSNPLKEVKQFSIEDREPASFSKEEISLLLSTITNKDIKNITLFGLWTGCRIGEILNIQWKDIDLQERVITIRNKDNFKTKNGKVRYIPISEKLQSLLESCTTPAQFPTTPLFLRSGVIFKKDYVSKQFKKYLRKAGLPEKFHFHSLRHTFITNLVKNNVNLNFVKELAGHSSLSTTLNYIHIGVEDLRMAVNCL